MFLDNFKKFLDVVTVFYLYPSMLPDCAQTSGAT